MHVTHLQHLYSFNFSFLLLLLHLIFHYVEDDGVVVMRIVSHKNL